MNLELKIGIIAAISILTLTLSFFLVQHSLASHYLAPQQDAAAVRANGSSIEAPARTGNSWPVR
jgi:hypothetical protein